MVYLRAFTIIYHKNQPNVGIQYIPYMDPMGFLSMSVPSLRVFFNSTDTFLKENRDENDGRPYGYRQFIPP